MSEHMSVTGSVNYYHLPYDCLAYCQYCKKNLSKLTIELHECFGEHGMRVICPDCKRTTWTSKIRVKRDKLDKKCSVCGNKTSYINAVCVRYSFIKGKRRVDYFCSSKCEKKEVIK